MRSAISPTSRRPLDIPNQNRSNAISQPPDSILKLFRDKQKELVICLWDLRVWTEHELFERLNIKGRDPRSSLKKLRTRASEKFLVIFADTGDDWRIRETVENGILKLWLEVSGQKKGQGCP